MEQDIIALRKAAFSQQPVSSNEQRLQDTNKRLSIALSRVADTCHATCNNSRVALQQAYDLLNELDPVRSQYQPKRFINNEEGA